MKARTPSHINGSALQAGPLIGRRHDLPSLASFKENAPRLKALNKHWKLYHGEDGWFAVNRRRTLPKRVQGRFASEKHRRLRRSTPFASCRKLSCIADLE